MHVERSQFFLWGNFLNFLFTITIINLTNLRCFKAAFFLMVSGGEPLVVAPKWHEVLL